MSDTAIAKKPVKSRLSGEKDDKQRILRAGDFRGLEFARQQFDAVMPADWDIDDALKPVFWSHVCENLKRDPLNGQPDRSGSIILLGTEDHAFLAHLYVRAVLPTGLIVSLAGPCFDPDTGKACPVDLQTGAPWKGRKPVRSSKFDLRWNGNANGFDVIDKATKRVIVGGQNFRVRELALAWIENASKSAA